MPDILVSFNVSCRHASGQRLVCANLFGGRRACAWRLGSRAESESTSSTSRNPRGPSLGGGMYDQLQRSEQRTGYYVLHPGAKAAVAPAVRHEGCGGSCRRRG